MKKDYRNKGFTLVEMIVVIVIIGILLAILVPGMFKYIQKAKEQQAIVECRAVVTAAQTLTYELYARDKFNYISDGIAFLKDHEEEILKSAEVDGDIINITFGTTYDKKEIKFLKYETSGKIIVVYDITSASVYTIENKSGGIDMSKRLEEYNKIYDKNGTGKWDISRLEFYNSDNSALSEDEIALLLKNTALSKEDLEKVKWFPCRYKKEDGSVSSDYYFVASNSSGNFNVSIAYFQGHYYYHVGNGGKTNSNSGLKDNETYSVDALINARDATPENKKNAQNEWLRIID